MYRIVIKIRCTLREGSTYKYSPGVHRTSNIAKIHLAFVLLPAYNKASRVFHFLLTPCCFQKQQHSPNEYTSELPQMDPKVEQLMGIEKVQLDDLNDGDQIAVCGDVNDLSRYLRVVTAHTNGKYLHHGIFVKENLAVIELQGETKETAKPKRRPLLEFFSGHCELYRVRYNDGECLPVAETMRRANEAVEKGNAWPAYSLIENNCESFATLLKTGRAVSKQALMALLNFLKVATPVLVTSSVSGLSATPIGPAAAAIGARGSVAIAHSVESRTGASVRGSVVAIALLREPVKED